MSEEDIETLLSSLENINIHRQQIDREERDILCQLHSLSSQWPGAPRGSTASQAAAAVSAHTFYSGQHMYITNPVNHLLPHEVRPSNQAAIIKSISGSRIYLKTYNGYHTWCLSNNLRPLTVTEWCNIQHSLQHPQ